MRSWPGEPRPGRRDALHPFGQALIRCLAACLRAERDGEDTLEMSETISRISNEWMMLRLEDSKPRSRLLQLAQDIFELVARCHLIDGFVPPEPPQVDELVPDIPGADSSRKSWMQWSGCYDVDLNLGPFGRVITEWPLADTAMSNGSIV